MSVVLVRGQEEFRVKDGALVIAEDAMIERAYSEACYSEAMKIAPGFGLDKVPHAKPLYHLLIAGYKRNGGTKGTVSFRGA